MKKRRWPLAVDPNPHSHCESDGPDDEQAYRRGFDHGMSMALDLPWVTVTRRKRHDRWLRAVYRWRHMQTHLYRTPPPEPRILDSERPKEFWKRWYKPPRRDDHAIPTRVE
jgi:hypothetical protein